MTNCFFTALTSSLILATAWSSGLAHARSETLKKAERSAAEIVQVRVSCNDSVRAQKSNKEAASTVSAFYFSEAEGRRQGFQVVLPPGFQKERKYPLFVQLFGGANLLPTRERPFIRARPSGRGVWGYRSMSRYDVMQVIRHTMRKYNIDENRVYLTGTSAGATGVMHVAAQRPDVFAGVVPLVAFGNDLPLENFRNLPIRCEHGVNDWTSAICNVRVQFQKLKKPDYDAILHEHPTAGHGIRVPPPATMDWLFRQRRNPSPEHVVYSCEHPRDGRAYWVRIERFADPHEVARIEAGARADGIRVTTKNVRRFSIDLSAAPLKRGGKLTVDGKSVELNAEKNRKELKLVLTSGEWRVASADTTPMKGRTARRVYGAGAAANLFQGEPLLVVYGTGAGERGNRFLEQLANVLARTGGSTFKPANVRFPVRADKKLGDVSLEKYNLLLIGSPRNNSLLRKIAVKLPYRIEDGVLHADNRKPLSLKGSVLGFHYFNPEHPHRLIYVFSPFLNEQQEKLCLQNPREFLAGSDGFKMIDQPDLFVRGVDLKIRREMQLDGDWKFIRIDGADRPMPKEYADRTNLARAHLKVMRKAAGVDYALWWGPKDKGLFGGYDFNQLAGCDPASFTFADYSVRRREVETMTAKLPGAELLDVFDRWIAKNELITWPEIRRRDIRADVQYRIVIPMDLVPKLGLRRKILGDVRAGPDIFPRQVLKIISASGK